VITSLHRAAGVFTAGVGLALSVAGLAGASAAAAAPSEQDRTWMFAAHQSNLTEIAAGRAAQQKATSDVVREHGEIFVRDHARLDASLRRLAQRHDVDLPSTPTPQQQSTLTALSARSGAAFDRAWLAGRLAGHRKALADSQTELASGSDATVEAAARAAAPVIEMHLAMLEQATDTSPSGADAGTGGQAATLPGGVQVGWALIGLGLAAAAAGIAVLSSQRARAE
jgi:putative membrane protein